MSRIIHTTTFVALVTVLAAAPGGAQPKKLPADPTAALAKKVTLNMEPGSGNEFLEAASKAADVVFVIDRTAFQRAGVLDFDQVRVGKVQVKDVPLAAVLADTLKAGGARFQPDKEYVLILPLTK